jgi:hypothetical protein
LDLLKNMQSKTKIALKNRWIHTVIMKIFFL